MPDVFCGAGSAQHLQFLSNGVCRGGPGAFSHTGSNLTAHRAPFDFLACEFCTIDATATAWLHDWRRAASCNGGGVSGGNSTGWLECQRGDCGELVGGAWAFGHGLVVQ
jgi:hypothetical protein